MRGALTFDVRSNMKDVIRDLREHPKIVEKAAISALNRIGQRAVTEARRALASEFSVTQKAFSRRISLARARRGMVSVAIYLRYKPLNPASFGRPRKTSKGVKVGRHNFDGAWPLPPGHVSQKSGTTFPKGIVLQRKGKSRYPTRMASIEIWPNAGEIVRQTSARVSSQEFEKRFRHEYEWRIGRMK